MPGDFIPHVKMMDTGFQSASLANLFGLQYVVIRKPKPMDTVTLNYNWQMNGTNAFSIYTNSTDMIDEKSARQAVSISELSVGQNLFPTFMENLLTDGITRIS